MKKSILSISLLILGMSIYNNSHAQIKFSDVLNTLKNGANTKSGSNTGSGLTSSEISSGLKEALKIGANNASSKLSSPDGFLKNAAVKILMPPEVRQVETKLRAIGLGSIVDKAIVAMNRAAEDASKSAAPIFVSAITTMSITDAVGILGGGNNAATNYLQGRTTSQLTAAFSPVIQKSLAKTGALELWSNVFNTYNKLPLVRNKINANLAGYVTERTLAGMFTSIAQEESKIRSNPAGQASSLIQKVFGR